MKFSAYTDNSNTDTLGVTINSCGHIFANSGRYINRPGGRCDWLIFYIAKGSEKFFLKQDIIAKAGSFIIFKPHEKQEHICISEKTSEFYYVHFTAPEQLLASFESSHIYQASPSAKICELFEELLYEIQLKAPGYSKICSGTLFRILGLLERGIDKSTDTLNEYISKIEFVIQLMNREFYAQHSLMHYATYCNMSKFHFLRVFKEITGESPIDYRNDIRIEHAKELLETTSLSINEIGTQVGYASATYFCDAFKKKVGISPIKYKNTKVKSTVLP